MRIGICDDERIARESIIDICRSFSKETGITCDIVEFSDGIQIITSTEHIDLLFLDIEMKNSSGIDIMNQLVSGNQVWRIVFVSSHDEMIMDIFGVKTLAFVKKPFTYEDIGKWLMVVADEIENDFIVELEEAKENKKIKSSDIIYIESKGNYSEVITKRETLLTRRTMSKWENVLKRGDFLRIHKSFIINMDYITQIGNEVILKDGSSFSIGRSYKKSSLDEYNNYVLEKMRNRR